MMKKRMMKRFGGMASKMKPAEMKKISSSKKSSFQDKVKANVRDMNKTGQGSKLRASTFIDKKTRRVVPDTAKNRQRYGSRVKKVK